MTGVPPSPAILFTRCEDRVNHPPGEEGRLLPACRRTAPFVALLFTAKASAAQRAAEFGFAKPDFETVGDADTVHTSVVTALAHDTRGMLWIGTQAGLGRYDGYRCLKHLHDPRNPGPPSGDIVTAMWVAVDGRIWVGTFRGLQTQRQGGRGFEPLAMISGKDGRYPSRFDSGFSLSELGLSRSTRGRGRPTQLPCA